MMFFYFVCILHLHFVFSGALPFDKRESPGTDLAAFLDENGKCKEDTTFRTDCNTCICKKGLQPGCTHKLCTLETLNITRIERDLPNPDSKLDGFLDENGKCKEDTTFNIDCNTCFCKKGFQPGCTEKLCIVENINITRIERDLPNPDSNLAGFLDEKGKCKEDTTYNIDCNTCFCKKGLQPGCTYKQCTVGNINITRIERDLPNPDSNLGGFLDENGKCKEDKKFNIDCNSCFCKKGLLPGCTDKLCTVGNINITRIERDLPHPDSNLTGFLDENGKCKVNTSFNIDCNACFCRKGFHPGCTQKFCIHNINITRVKRELSNSHSHLAAFLDENGKCKEDTSVNIDCNTCVCKKGFQPGCTYKLCTVGNINITRIDRDLPNSNSSLDDFLDENGKCKEDASFKWDCNTCQCQKGSQPGCTYRLCPENLNKTVRIERDVSKSEPGKIPPGGLCKPGERWKLDECNNCVCTHNGYASCTLNDCSTSKGRPKRNPASTGTVPPEGKCKPGDRWKLDECNNCVCTHTGFASCTLNDCSAPKKKPKRSPADAGKLPPGGKCNKPGERWKLDECNECVCTHTGYASCTLNDCTTTKGRPKRSPATTGTVPPAGKCKPGDRWKLDECNNCVCTHTGFASCTLNDCSAPKKKPKRSPADAGKLNPEGRCKPGERWKLDECNNCVCTHTGYASCTLNDCSIPQKRPKRASDGAGTIKPGGKCKPGEKWNLDECNKCVCTHNGFASCSLNECPQKGRRKRSTDTSHFSNFVDQSGKCKQNASFKWDCNTCNCQKGYKPGCTYAMCLKSSDKFRKTKREASNFESGLSEFVDEHGKCQQRATFRLDCNSCFCSQKGKYASCTLKACPEYKNKTQRLTRDARNENGNSGLECKPGVSWKENCNSCFCSERGIAMCTDIPTCPSPPPAPAKEIPDPKSAVVPTSQSSLTSSTTLESFTPSESPSTQETSLEPASTQETSVEPASTQETSLEPASTTDASDVSNTTELVSTTEVQ